MIQSSIRSAPAALAALLFCAAGSILYAGPVTRPTTRDVRDAVDRDEELRELLGEQNAGLIARVKGRMEQSAQRLAAQNDPGAQTQEIQRRIINDIDDLIDAAAKNPPPPPKGKKAGNPADGANGTVTGPQSTGATEAADKSDKPGAGDAAAKKLSPELRERAEAFMQIAPRAVPAVIEGATEQVSPKYRNLTEAYYKAIAAAGSRDR